jgi:hypothetical protein
LAIDVASTGRFIMTCTPKNELDVLDLKGNLLASVITNQMETYSAKISPDGRFVATSGSQAPFSCELHRAFILIVSPMQDSRQKSKYGRLFSPDLVNSKS